MQISNVLQCLYAAHLSFLVESPWEERGGILIVAPPGTLKTTLINSLSEFPEALCLSDINVKSLVALRDDIMGGRYRTLAFGEMEKLYARNPATAANIEGHLRQFVEEGLRHASFEDARMAMPASRCLVVSGMTPSLYGRRLNEWLANGFLRRFIVCQYLLANDRAISTAIHEWKKMELTLPTLWNGTRQHIKYNLTSDESAWLGTLLKDQAGSATPYVLLKKIACVLKKRSESEWRATIKDFAGSFRKGGALLTL